MGCSTVPAQRGEHLASESEQLTGGGVATDAATPDLRAVGTLSFLGLGCSGTLIAPRTVLTAAHCFFPAAHGCAVNMGDPTFTFADSSGNPSGMGAQVIKVVGVSAHPDAYGFDSASGNPGRVASCPNPNPLPTACPDPTVNVNALLLPSCAIVQACFPSGIGALPACVPMVPCPASIVSQTIGGLWGLKSDHDLALAFLESEPVGISPLPVLTRGWSDPAHGVFEATAAKFDSWVAGKPTVTVAGYGQGSKTSVTRDVGTTQLTASQLSLNPPPDCQGNIGPATLREIWGVSPGTSEATAVPGDSGGPIFFGQAPIVAGPTPSTLPSGTSLTEQRYVVGVFSGPGNLPSLLQADNAAWLKSRLQDFDGDGWSNSNDNCIGIANGDQTNCNSDAEEDRQAAVLGDACDPVPCPNGEADVSSSSASGSGIISVSSAIRDQIQLDTVGSHNPVNGAIVGQTGIMTYFRFCQPNPTRGITCTAATGQMTHPQFLNPATGGPDNPWLPVTLAGVMAGTNPPVDYPSHPVPFTWSYQADYQTWRTANWVDAAPPAPLGGLLGGNGSTGLDGTFGLRAGDAMDDLGTAYQPSNGVHPSPIIDVYAEGAAMARHYFAVAPDRTSVTFNPPVSVCQGICVPDCPACQIAIPWHECTECNPSVRLPIGDDPWVLVPGLAGRWQLLGPTLTGSLGTDASTRLSPSLRALLADPAVRYVDRVEPGVLDPGALTTNLRQGVLLSTTGTTLQAFAVSTPLGLALEQEPVSVNDGLSRSSTPVQIVLPASATLATSALGTLGGQLLVDDRVQVLGASGGYASVTGVQGMIRVGSDAKVGSVFTDVNVDLRARAAVKGSLWAGTSLQADSTATVAGTRTVGQRIQSGDSEAWTVAYPTTNQGPRSLEPSQTLSLSPGAFGAVTVMTNAKLSLRAGTYYFTSLELEPSSTLDLDNRTGAVFLYVRNTLIYRGKTTERDATKPNVLFGFLGTSTPAIEAPFRGLLVAPNAQLTLATVGSPGHTGAFYGKSLEVAPDNIVHHRPFARGDCTSSFGCLGGWEPTGPIPSAARSLGIAARTNFVPIFSQRTSQVFVIGGTLSGTSTLTKQIVNYDITSGVSRVLALLGSYAPEKVLAATLSFTDNRLWILDELASGGTTRLAHVDPLTGSAQIVWQGTPSGGYDHYYMTTDKDGSLLLTASSLTSSKFATVRARWLPFAAGTEKLFKVHTGLSGLLGAGIPSTRGITYVIAGPGGAISRLLLATALGQELAISDLGPWL
jgi:hypothetical protein